MYKKVDTDMNFVDREKKTVQFWKENDIFRKSIEMREGGPTYMFYDGPPTANGKPHIGHVLTRVIKDTIPRYHAMKGEYIPRKAGWDTHGLPVEIEVEKLLGLDGKEQIEEYGVEPFIQKCKESVWKYEGMWREFSDVVGFWADMDHPYVTYHDDFIESEWWALQQIFNKGLLYEGHKIVPYCPRCGTPLSSHEVAQGYKAVKERSAIVRFRALNTRYNPETRADEPTGETEEAYFLAWTTTPWTLASNVSLCVNPDEDYVRVKAADGYVYIMAEALVDQVLGHLSEEVKPEILKKYKGRDLEYFEYEPLYQCAADAAAKQRKKGFYVMCDSYVTMTDGTGIVHCAPAFGEDDNRVCSRYNLPFLKFVNEKGEMTEETPFAGMRAKPSEKEIAEGAEALVKVMQEFTEEKQGFVPKIVLICPPEIGPGIETSPFRFSFTESAIERSKALPEKYRKVAEKHGLIFVNAAEHIAPSEADSLHLMPEAHRALAEVLADVVRENMEEVIGE